MERLEYFTNKVLSDGAADLIQFDMESLRHVVAAQHGDAPDVWLADPDGYERNGRVLRDSPSSRLLAYSAKDQALYATDGCNSCSRRLDAALETLNDSELEQLARDNELPMPLLKCIVEIRHGAE